MQKLDLGSAVGGVHYIYYWVRIRTGNSTETGCQVGSRPQDVFVDSMDDLIRKTASLFDASKNNEKRIEQKIAASFSVVPNSYPNQNYAVEIHELPCGTRYAEALEWAQSDKGLDWLSGNYFFLGSTAIQAE